MKEQVKTTDINFINYLLFKLLLILFKLSLVTSAIDNHSCYTCIEPLVGYSKNLKRKIYLIILYISIIADHTDSCRFFNTASSVAWSYMKDCNIDNYIGEYECRKLIISYRSVDTYLRRDCVPKGLCSWKDRTQSMINTPVSDCVYTDDSEQKLECIYCCDTPLCNRTKLFYLTNPFLIGLWIIFCRKLCNYQ